MQQMNNSTRFVFVYREESNLDLPPLGHYATGIFFVDTATRQKAENKFADLARECGIQVYVVIK